MSEKKEIKIKIKINRFTMVCKSAMLPENIEKY